MQPGNGRERASLTIKERDKCIVLGPILGYSVGSLRSFKSVTLYPVSKMEVIIHKGVIPPCQRCTNMTDQMFIQSVVVNYGNEKVMLVEAQTLSLARGKHLSVRLLSKFTCPFPHIM